MTPMEENALEALMETAGVGEKAKKKLRAANKAASSELSDETLATRRRPRGHGAASLPMAVVDEL